MRLLLRIVKQYQRCTQTRAVCQSNFSTVSDLSGPLRDCSKGETRAWVCGSSPHIVESVREFVEVQFDFITKEEEQALLKELEPGLKKKRYEFDHWDDVSGLGC